VTELPEDGKCPIRGDRRALGNILRSLCTLSPVISPSRFLPNFGKTSTRNNRSASLAHDGFAFFER
jgi:hypothetical protein